MAGSRSILALIKLMNFAKDASLNEPVPEIKATGVEEYGQHVHSEECGHVLHDPTCVFCKIIQHELPAKILYADQAIIIIQDIKPMAKNHFLAIPRLHVCTLEDLTPGMLYHLLIRGRELCRQHSFEPKVLINEGTAVIDGVTVGKAVDHFHIHFLSYQ